MIDVTQARQDYADYLMTTAYSITRTYPTTTTLTGICTFGPRAGKQEQGDQIVERGSYAMAVDVDADVLATDRVVIGARTFRVVWSPPPTELSIAKQFGLEETR